VRRGHRSQSGGGTLRAFGALAACLGLVAVSACARPEVDVPRKLGALGEFCITTSDCSSGVGCRDSHCCGKDTCGADCIAWLTREGTVATEAAQHSPEDRRAFQKACVSLCCGGASLSEIEQTFANGIARAHLVEP
jgi:hypothetical protein